MAQQRIGWTYDPLEFYVGWQHLGRDRMPFPLVFHADTQNATDFARQYGIAAKALQRRMDEQKYRALFTLANPVVRAEVVGVEQGGAASGMQADSMIRVHAGVDHSAGVVAVQSPGVAFESGGEVVVSMHSVSNTAARIVDVLPSAPPGRTDGIAVPKADLVSREPVSPDSWQIDSWQVEPGQAARTFFGRPFYRMFEVTVDKGTSYDGWKEGTGRGFTLIDYVDDGRYLVRKTATTISAVPATSEVVAAEAHRHFVGYLSAARQTI